MKQEDVMETEVQKDINSTIKVIRPEVSQKPLTMEAS